MIDLLIHGNSRQIIMSFKNSMCYIVPIIPFLWEKTLPFMGN